MAVKERTLTQGQRGHFARHTRSMFNKALHVLGRDAEDITRVDPIVNQSGEIHTSATFKLGEVVYTISVTGKREEASA